MAVQFEGIDKIKAKPFSKQLTEKEIIKKLQDAYDPKQPPECPYPENILSTKLESAAVLIPFLWQNNEWQILFIQRAQNESDQHRGQIAFPGGRCEPKDSNAKHTALREAFEETGIQSRDVTILGQIRDIVTISNYQITPIVGLIPWPYIFAPQIEEVSKIFTIPLNWLGSPTNRGVKERELPNKKTKVPVVYYKAYEGEILWGASARITLLLLEALQISNPKNRYR